MNPEPWDGPWTDRMMDRVLEDMVMMQDMSKWPPGQGFLWLKTQPWITERDGRMRSAHLLDPRVPTAAKFDVAGTYTGTIEYTSFLQLAKTWSID